MPRRATEPLKRLFMKHHFVDFLDREGGYWTMLPNHDRYAFALGDCPEGSPEVRIATIGENEPNWRRVLTLPNLEELTLHEPTQAQLNAVSVLTGLKRLRVTHARPRDIEFVRPLSQLEELVLEHVSGVRDLSPLSDLKRLRALHTESLRGVKSFDGLSNIDSLRSLSIFGALNWKQPIEDFEFLGRLPNLEFLRLSSVVNRTAYPAMLPATTLQHLKKLSIRRNLLAAEEFALLEVALPGVKGADWGPYTTVSWNWLPMTADDDRGRLPEDVLRANHPEVLLHPDGSVTVSDPETERIEFTGKGTRHLACRSSKAVKRCRERAERYEDWKAKARKTLDTRVVDWG
ncbi:MAG: hypothetical protein ACI82G_002050, partial [Bradymonadia bacterium]